MSAISRGEAPDPPTVVFFRHQLFRLSEPFIAAQGESLKGFRPVYVGRTVEGEPPSWNRVRAMQQIPKERAFSRRVWQAVSRASGSYESLLEADAPVVVHAHFGVDGVYALPLSRRLHVPLVTSFYGFDATLSRGALLRSGSPAWLNYLALRHTLARRGAMFICVSKFLKKKIVALGFPAERTVVNYIGVDTNRLKIRDPNQEISTIVHVGRLVEKKGTEYLLRAFARLSSTWPAAELVIVGDGPLHESLRMMARELGVGQAVRFLGSLPHDAVLGWLRRASVLAVPSVTAESGDMEGLPMIVLEGAALGLPIVATLHSGIPEAIVDGDTGFLVPERDVEALALRLGTLLANDGLRARMGRRARSMVEEIFDLNRQTLRLETLYEEVL